MSSSNTALSVVGRLIGVAALLGVFMLAMASVVYMSLQGAEVTVPEITGKELNAGEDELAALGLKMKRRAERFSAEPPGTVVEQLPKPGETVKTGQLILVVTSKGPGEGGLPSTLKTDEEDDTEKIEEMISDRPKKPRANTNSNRKKADTARDVNAAASNVTTGATTLATGGDSNKREPVANTGTSPERPNRNTQAPTPARPPASTGRPPSSDPTPRPRS